MRITDMKPLLAEVEKIREAQAAAYAKEKFGGLDILINNAGGGVAVRDTITVTDDEIDRCIKERNDEALTLSRLSEKLNYSEYHLSRKFRQVSGMTLREYLRQVPP